MHEEQVRHRREDQGLVRREGKALDNPASTKGGVRLTRRADDRSQQTRKRCEQKLRPTPIFAGESAYKGTPSAGDEKLIAGEDGDLGNADI